MIIFLKTQTTGTPLDIDDNATLSELCSKANERMGKDGQLVFAGKPITPSSSQTLKDLNITKEATLHFMQKKVIKISLDIEYDCQLKTISIPSDKKVTIRDLKREVRNAFPDESDFGRQLPDLFCNDKELKNNQKICDVLENGDHISITTIAFHFFATSLLENLKKIKKFFFVFYCSYSLLIVYK